LLSTSITQLKVASNKFNEAEGYLKEFTPENQGKEVFIPLTSSVYVLGNMANVSKVIVDVGTGYYLEKSIKAAQEYTDRSAKDINAKVDHYQKQLDAKKRSLVQIQMVFQAKMAHQQQQAGK